MRTRPILVPALLLTLPAAVNAQLKVGTLAPTLAVQRIDKDAPVAFGAMPGRKTIVIFRNGLFRSAQGTAAQYVDMAERSRTKGVNLIIVHFCPKDLGLAKVWFNDQQTLSRELATMLKDHTKAAKYLAVGYQSTIDNSVLSTYHLFLERIPSHGSAIILVKKPDGIRVSGYYEDSGPFLRNFLKFSD
jgi:hypothetical protein